MKNDFYTFPGLLPETIKHPDEDKAYFNVMRSKKIQSLLKQANDLSVEFFIGTVRGSYVELSEETAPDFFRVLKDVCRILNFPEIPRVFTRHAMSQEVIACGSEEKYLVVSDYTMDEFNEDEMYYLVGNAIAMYKAGHTDLSNLLQFLGGQLFFALDLPLKAFLRAADLSSDRGGLLACQSFAAAARCHFHELGLPLSQSRELFKTDEEAETFVSRYLETVDETQDENEDILIHIIKGVQNLAYFEGPANKMLAEMYRWYTDPKGYRRIIRTQGRPANARI